MFTVKSQNELIAKLDDAIESKLSEVVMVFPALRETIINNMLWGIFSNNYLFSGTANGHSKFEYLTHFSHDIVVAASNHLETIGISNPQFFDKLIADQIKTKHINIFLDREECNVLIEKFSTSQSIKNDVEIILSPTIPDSSLVFKDFILGDVYDQSNFWILEYMDLYDSVQHELMQSLHKYFVQIGGHGCWIQNEYNGIYVAQFNIEIGDCGSLFVEYHNDKFHGFIDMF